MFNLCCTQKALSINYKLNIVGRTDVLWIHKKCQNIRKITLTEMAVILNNR